jgi:hypothetical protein
MIQINLAGITAPTQISFVKSEVELLAGLTTNFPFETIQLKIDAALEPGAWQIELPATGQLDLSGQDYSALLGAVYTLFEQLGWVFLSTGAVPPTHSGTATAMRLRPFLLWRGIREHINFPMDISAWSCDDAMEFVRNLARQKYNMLTFHSYPGQWIEYQPATQPKQLAGGFFYSETIPVPADGWLHAAAGNQDIWSMPEASACYYEPDAKSAVAVNWLRDLMNFAKSAGMRLQFSFEPRCVTEVLDETLLQAEAVLNAYPMIDVLELITQETGDWGDANGDDLVAVLQRTIPETVLRQPVFQQLLNGKYTSLRKVLGEAGHNLMAIRALIQRFPERQFAAGVYCVEPAYLEACAALWRQLADPRCGLAILCGHGSGRVTRYFPRLKLTAAELRRVTIYSWIEFDGLMYVQQDGSRGIEQLYATLAHLEDNTQRPAVLFNHWRVAENELCIKYAAAAAVLPNLQLRDHTLNLAGQLGVVPPERFQVASALLADLTDTITESLPNIGFCFFNCWKVAPFAPLDWMKLASIPVAIDGYEAVLRLLGNSVQPVPAIALLINRVESSIIYLRGLYDLRDVVEQLNQLPQGKVPDAPLRRKIDRMLDQAAAQVRHSITHAGEILPDRAAVGNLISIHFVILRYIEKVRDSYGFKRQQIEVKADRGTAVDAPAPPINPGNQQ